MTRNREDTAEAAEAFPEGEVAVNKNKRHRKEKPWDTDDIDHWKIDAFKPEDMSGSLLEESNFATLFPRYREAYLKEIWPHVTKALAAHGIACELNLVEGSMTVRTTRKTFDPYIIIKARDLVKLLARSVPLPNALRVLEDGIMCDIIKVGNILRSRERFVKRRQRLVGPNGNTLKAIELLTQCYILVQGNTVSAIGEFKNLKLIRRIVLDCMNNIHPIYHIKELMIKRELAKDEKLKNESWDRFLPKFRKLSSANRKKKLSAAKDSAVREKKEYTPFPPAPAPRLVDLQMESGEYFLKPEEKEAKKIAEKVVLREEKRVAKEIERAKAFIAPEEQSLRRTSDGAKPEQRSEAEAEAIKKEAKEVKSGKESEKERKDKASKGKKDKPSKGKKDKPSKEKKDKSSKEKKDKSSKEATNKDKKLKVEKRRKN